MIGFLPTKFIEPQEANRIDKSYLRYRFELFLTAYIGYVAYYFVQNTLALAKPYLIKDGLSISDVGYLGSALAVTYGLSKFIIAKFTSKYKINPQRYL